MNIYGKFKSYMIEPWELYEVLPKNSLRWETDDVLIWLEEVGLNCLASTFRKLKWQLGSKKVDGKALATLTQ